MIARNFITFALFWSNTRSFGTKSWIRKMPIESGVNIGDYSYKQLFPLVAQGYGHKKSGHLVFRPVVPPTLFRESREWIYLITIKDCIVKIGGTRVGLHGRITSYLSGRSVHNGSTTVSTTNACVYNTLDYYFQNGYPIGLYAYALPIIDLKPVDILDCQDVTIRAQTYQAYETIFLEDYKKKYGEIPYLNKNWDPIYRKDIKTK